jgi:hypothetical protein
MQQQRSQKHRAILTEQQAIEIFRFRSENSMSVMVSSALFVAKRYGINERTVRDIWKQRTWNRATSTLAEGTGPMAKKKMGRPIGSKDTRPRKQKLAAGTSIFSNSSTPITPSKYDARLRSHGARLNCESQQSATASVQLQDSAARRLLFDFLLLEPSDEAACIGDRSLIEDAREVEVSIDDQLHAWAHCGSQWIVDAALSLDGENPLICTPPIR